MLCPPPLPDAPSDCVIAILERLPAGEIYSLDRATSDELDARDELDASLHPLKLGTALLGAGRRSFRDVKHCRRRTRWL